MKKFIALTLTLLMVMSCIPTSVFAEDDGNKVNGDFSYTLSGDKLVITGYTGSDKFVDVPAEIDEHGVTEIASSAFNGTQGIVGVQLPEGITTLHKGTFDACDKLEYISLPASLKTIEDGSLSSDKDCLYIVERNSEADSYVTEKDLNITRRFASDTISESGVTGDLQYRYLNSVGKLYVYGSGDMPDYGSADSQPWKGYRDKIKTLKLYSGINTIGNYAFSGCSAIDGELVIPDTVKRIGNYAFNGVSKITSLDIKGNSDGTVIGERAFNGASALTAIELGNITQIGYAAFYGSGITGTLSLPDSLTALGDYAFQSSSKITSIEFPKELTTISAGAFYDCRGLTEIVIPDNIVTIKNMAFRGCNAVTSITLGSGVAQIGDYDYYSYAPFYEMTGVKTVTFTGENVPKASYVNIFNSMNSLQTIYVPENSYSKYISAYSGYAKNAEFKVKDNEKDYLIDENGVLLSYQGSDVNVVIPDNVTEIGPSAFRANKVIKSVELTDNVTKIDSMAFYGCTALKSVTLGKNVESIGSSAFYGCTALISAAMSEKINTIAASAFSGCKSLEKIDLPEGLESIGTDAFSGCTALEQDLVIPASVKTIGENAFRGDSRITGLEIKGNEEGTKIGNRAFESTSAMASVTLGNVTSIGDYAFNASGITGKLTIPDSVTSMGTGAFQSCTKITGLEISKSLTNISDNAFYSCTGLKELIIPDNIVNIGNMAFRNCNAVTNIVIGSGVTRIGNYDYYPYNPFYEMAAVKTITYYPENVPAASYADLFYSMNNLESVYVPALSYSKYVSAYSGYINNARILMTSEDEFVVSDGVLLQYTGSDKEITIPDTVEEIGQSALKNNKEIEKVTFGKNVKTVQISAFQGCTSLKEVVFNDSLEVIGNYAFSGDTAIVKADLTSNINTIGQYSFNGCTALASLTIPASVTTIGNDAFLGCSGIDTDLVIPAAVLTIGNEAFKGAAKLTGLEIKGNEEGTTIGSRAFESTSALKTLTLGNVKSIGEYAFNASGITGKLTIPNSVTSMSTGAFQSCTKITELEISKSLTTISDNAFYSCTGLRELTIPDNIANIGNMAFRNCNAVTSIVIGSGVTQIGNYDYYSYNPFYEMTSVKTVTFNSDKVPAASYKDIFYSMNNLETVNIPAASAAGYIKAYASYINNGRFYAPDSKEDFIIDENGTLVLYQGDEAEVTVPDSVKEIGYAAFIDNNSIESVTISDKTEKIASSAFLGCTKLSSVTFGSEITEIGSYAFYRCSALTELNLPSKLTTIGAYAFNACTGLTSLTIPVSVQTIGNYAFGGCSKIEGKLTIPESVVTIGEFAFKDNKYSEAEIKGCADGTTISNRAFEGMSTLKTLTLGNVKTIGTYAFNGTGISGKLTIPQSVTSMGEGAFYNCAGITELEIGSGLTSIAPNAFYGCKGLSEIVIPDNITSVGNMAFRNCSGVTSITVGSGVTSLGSYDYYSYNPFHEMSSVKTVTFKSEKVPSAGYKNIFYSMGKLETVYVPVESYSDYIAAYTDYVKGARILMNSDDEFVIKDGVLLQYTGNSAEVTIPDDVTEIGDSAFKNNTNIEKITFSDKVETVGTSAFAGCTGLVTCDFNKNLGIIETSAFSGCTKLENAVLKTIVKIGSYAFNGCTGMSGKLTLPATIKSIGDYAFNGCNGIEELEILGDNEGTVIGAYAFNNASGIKKASFGNTTTIGQYAFAGCTGINTELQFNETLTSIGNYAFQNCKNISGKLSIPDSVTYIGVGAFQYCSGISELKLPQKLTAINEFVFDGCSGLEEIDIPDKVASVANYAFRNCSKAETLILGTGLKTIGTYDYYTYNPFLGMTNVKEVIFRGDTLPSAPYKDIFYSMNILRNVYLTIEGYKAFGNVYSMYINNAKYRIYGNDNDFVINENDELLIYQGEDAVVTIPDNVKSIQVSAFQNNTLIEEVTFNENLQSVGAQAFENCINLKKVNINKNLITISKRAFYGCSSLEELNLNDSLTYIGESAFANCTSLSGEIRFSETLETVGNYAFDNDKLIKSVKFAVSEERTSIGSYAFRNASAMTNLDLGGVKTIGAYAFAGCSGLIDTLVIPDTVSSLGEGAFSSCSGITGVKLSASLKSIPQLCFAECKSLEGEIEIPSKVDTIGNRAFLNCSKVTSIVLGEKVATIGQNDYYYDNPFHGMTAVKEVMFLASIVPSCAFKDMFYSMDGLETVFIPTQSEDEYKAAFTPYINNAVFATDTLRYGVKNLVAENVFTSTVRIGWSEHQNDSVISYIVSRNDKIVGRTQHCQFTDYDLVKGETYKYGIYGITEAGETTQVSEISVVPKEMEFIGISTAHNQNTISESDGNIYIDAKNEANYEDLDGNPVSGRLYYIKKDGTREFIGKSTLTVNDIIRFTVNWDVKDIEPGEYDVVFEYTDPDETVTECKGKVRVDKSIPETITNVVAIGDYNSIQISWAQSSEVASTIYRIYRRSEVDIDYSLLATVKGRTNLSYTDTTVKKDRLYYYYVITENTFGIQSEPSEEAVAMRSVDEEPPVVSKIIPAVNTKIGGNQTIKVEAIDNLMLASSKLYYSLDEQDWTLIGTAKSYPFEFIFNTKELDDGDVYVKAVAYDARGNESEGKVVKYTVDNTGPDAVTGFVLSSANASNATLKWDETTADDAASYVLEQKLSNGNFTIIKSGITTNGYVVENLIPGSEYTYRVAAVDTLGNVGKYSEELTISTNADTTAPTITALSPQAGRTKGAIRFSASAGDDTGIKSLAIQVSTDLKKWENLSVAEYTNVSKTVSYSFTVEVDKFDEGSIYVRAVAADFADNKSDESDSAAFVEYIIDRTSPGSPRDLRAVGGEDYIYLTWLQGDEEDLGTYSVYRSNFENEGFVQLASGLSKISYFDTTAEYDKVYYYKIAVCDTLGNVSEFSSTVSAKMTPDVTKPEVVSVAPDTNSSISKKYHTVYALVKDNDTVDSVTFEYKIDDAAEYKTLKTIKNINNYYANVEAEIPVEGLTEKNVVYVRVFCKDTAGHQSEYSIEYKYLFDETAPGLSNLKAELNEDTVTITWNDNSESDLAGYKVYRVNAEGTEEYIGARSPEASHSYTFIDTITEGDYSYKLEAYDKSENSNSFLTDIVSHTVTPENNKAPNAVINGFETMELGVEEYFDAYSSTDDDSILAYSWNFGDGTTSNDIQPVKKYTALGVYTVTLEVTDSYGLTGKAEFTVNVRERAKVGRIRVNIVDEEGKKLANAPVYYNLGTDSQKVVYTDASGSSIYNMDGGESEIGCYMTGYLPASKVVKVLPNATRTITLTLIKEELVTGTFEVTRMTFNEIKDAGIDVYDPANQNVYSVRVTLKYSTMVYTVEYVRNDRGILSYGINGNGGRGIFGRNGFGGFYYVPNKEGKEVIAVLQFDAGAKTLKEFFDVKLHIVNNATSDFVLKNNAVDLKVPRGMTLMKNLAQGWYTDSHVEFAELRGQETKTLSWILRGDEIGKYDLVANYSAILDKFNESVEATFKTEDPIEVYGMSNFEFDIQVCDTIKYNGFYFNIGLKNAGEIDLLCPKLDFDGIVSNITSAATGLKEGDKDYKEDFEVKSRLLNVRCVAADGSKQYVRYNLEQNGCISTKIDTLAPGETIYFDFVAYNATDFFGTAEFKDATYEVLEGVGGGVKITPFEMNLYSTKNSDEKLEAALEENSDQNNALKYILEDDKYIYLTNATIAAKFGNHIYKTLRFLLTLDLDTLTERQMRDSIDKMICDILLDGNVASEIDTLVDTRYEDTAKDILSYLDNSFASINFDPDKPGSNVGTVIKSALKNQNIISSLAGDLETLSGQELENAFYVKLGLGASVAAADAGIQTAFRRALSDSDSVLKNSISNVSKYGSLAIDLALVNPTNAYNQAVEAEYYHAQMKLLANKNAANFLLNTLINCYNKDQAYKELAYEADLIAHNPIAALLYEAGHTNYASLIVLEAQKIKKEVNDNASVFAKEFAERFAESTATTVAQFALSEMLSIALGDVGIIYELLGAVFETVDALFGLEAFYKAVDTYEIATYLTLSIKVGYEIMYMAYLKNDRKKIENANLFAGTDVSVSNLTKYELATYTLYQLKSLCQIRLMGERTFFEYNSEDNTNIMVTDEMNDKGVVYKYNSVFGTSCKDLDELCDYIYGNILSARDTIFNVENITEAEQPEAPEVEINYDTLTTKQAFFDDYEYCYADGVWHTCSGFIPVHPKKVSSILRVRKRSGGGFMSGKITTVTVYSRKELSKTISVKYSDNVYTVSNLNEKYEYQVCSTANNYDKVDWSNAKTIKNVNTTTVTGLDEGNYLAIRSLKNDSLSMMNSYTSFYPVAKKQRLNVVVEGDGSVTQTNASGYYFEGEDIDLTAVSDNNTKFIGWFVNGERVSVDREYILEMYKHAKILAKFDSAKQVPVSEMQILLSNGEAAEDNTVMYVGQEEHLGLEIAPANSTDKSVEWTVDNEDIATISADGVFKPIADGTVKVTAKAKSGVTAEFTAVINKNKLEKLVVVRDLTVKNYYEGDAFNNSGIKIAAVYSDGTSKYVDDFTLSGFDSLTAGEKTITVAYGGLKTSTTVTVNHNADWKTKSYPTCTAAGTEEKICSTCGEVVETREIPTIPHNYEWKVTTEATETTDGVKSHICTMCGDVDKTETITAHEHNYTGTLTEPTCDTDGYITYECTVCGDTYKVGADQDDTLKAKGHNYETTVVAPDCNSKGYTLNVCTNCGHTFKSNYTDKTEHNYETRVVEASCQTEGYTEKYCTICGDSEKTNITPKTSHSYQPEKTEATCDHGAGTKYVCKYCGDFYVDEETEALGHNYKSSVVEPTCTEDGYILYECTVCGDSYKTDIVPKTGHSFGEWLVKSPSTEEVKGVMYRYCVNCGEEETKRTDKADREHIKGEWKVVKEATCDSYGVKAICCTTCGEMLESEPIQPLGHSYKTTVVEPTCTSDGYTFHECENCGDSYKTDLVSATGHIEGEWKVEKEPTCTDTGLKVKRCTVCNEILDRQIIATVDHTEVAVPAVAATCENTGLTEGVRCAVCGEIIKEQKIVAKLNHTEVIDKAVAATCEETGLTEGSHCSVCNKVLKAQEIVPALGHTKVTDKAVAASCEEPGLTEGSHCSVCNKVLKAQEEIPALGHKKTTLEAVAPTCEEQGYTEGIYCSVCGKVFQIQEPIPALGHTEVIDQAVAATCEETGLTEGSHCSVCNKVLKAQEIVPALGHTEVTDKAVAATCEETGLTEGSHCSVCNKVLKAQEIVPALGHTEVTDKAVAASCEEPGLTEGSHCSVCNKVLKAQEIVPALGHTEVTDKAVAATCEDPGLTEGSHCSVCNKVLKAQEIVPALGHTEVIDKAVQPDCLHSGLTEGSHCLVCGKVIKAQETVGPSEHKLVYDREVPATCYSTGLTEGIHCSVCGEIIKAQEIVPKTEHSIVIDKAEPADCQHTGLTEGIHCEVCGEIIKAQETAPKTEHTIVIDEAVQADCQHTGLTEGSHCAVCGVVLKAQEIVPKTEHTAVIDKAVEADCQHTGLTEGSHCAVCGEVIKAQQTIAKTEHTIVIDEAVQTGCQHTGLTEGSHCAVCGEIIKAQAIVGKIEHVKVIDEAVAADCQHTGLTEGSHCAVCGEVIKAQEIVEKTAHTVVIDAAVAATSTHTGLTEGSHCSVCGEIIVAQQVLPKVANKTKIKLSPTKKTLYVKGSVKISVKVTNGVGKTTFSSSNTKIAKVSKSGKVTALKAGTAKITVTNNKVKAVFKVKVINPTLNAKSKVLKKGKTFTIKVKGKIGTAKFVSSNKKVATVSKKGVVKAKTRGTAYISVKVNGITLICRIRVK